MCLQIAKIIYQRKQFRELNIYLRMFFDVKFVVSLSTLFFHITISGMLKLFKN